MLVISKEDLGDDVIVAKITSTPGHFRVPITQKDVEGRRMKKAESYVDCSAVFTVSKDVVEGRIGRLREEKLQEVLRTLATILGVCNF